MSNLIEQIQKYADLAGALEPGPGERARLMKGVNDYVENFLGEVASRPAFIQSESRGRGLYDSPISESGMDIEAVLEQFKVNVDDVGLSPVSAGFLGYIPPCSQYLGALGDFLAAVTNKFAGDFSSCPGAVRMDHQLLRWMADLVGYPAGAVGNLASGGSVAILSAVVTAREAHELSSADYPRAVAYVTGHTHHALDKSLHIAGLGECVVRRVPMDAAYRMDPARLGEIVRQDRRQGLKPWLLVGSAGTTDLGSIDPLDRLADVAAAEGLWYHVDGAYGALFMLSELVRERFHGIERSDSVVMNPHKALFTPFGLGALLVRQGDLLRSAHFHTANYLQDTLIERDEISPADLGPELTRHFRAPRMWLPLKVLGVAPFRAALSEKILLARYAYERIAALEGFEVGPPPELSILAFRYLPGSGDADEFNRRLLAALRDDGTVFLSSTSIDGRYMIRLAILSFRTHRETVDLAIDKIRHYTRVLRGK